MNEFPRVAGIISSERKNIPQVENNDANPVVATTATTEANEKATRNLDAALSRTLPLKDFQKLNKKGFKTGLSITTLASNEQRAAAEKNQDEKDGASIARFEKKKKEQTAVREDGPRPKNKFEKMMDRLFEKKVGSAVKEGVEAATSDMKQQVTAMEKSIKRIEAKLDEMFNIDD